MVKAVFKDYSQGQSCLFPMRLDEKIPANAPVRLINQIVDTLDISKVIDTYKGGGTSSYHPRMMLKVVLFAYLNNIYSCRKIENALQDRLTFMWLSGSQTPDHNTINTFRSSHLKTTINEIFTQVVLLLVDMGYLSLDTVYVDGTKLESRANRYTFVWKKTVEKNKARLEGKIQSVLEQIEEGIARDNQPNDDPPTPINSEELRRRIAEINHENLSKENKKAVKTLENNYLPKLEEYEAHLETLGNRGSYSKTDQDATFMRMKDDPMGNGSLKPAYNLQIGTENQFYTHFDFFPNPTDYLTFIPFNKGFNERYGKLPQKEVADAGYGTEENYEFMENHAIEAYVKYPSFDKEQTSSFKNNSFLAQNLPYNTEKDYLVCPIGLQMANAGTATRKRESGYVSKAIIYQAENCDCCPLKSHCYPVEGNRRIEINHKLNGYRKKARELLISEEGLKHRRKRSTEPEAVFGQTKANKQYNRFRHFGLDKVKMDFAIFAIAFNIGKLYNKAKITTKNKRKLSSFDKNTPVFVLIMISVRKISDPKDFFCLTCRSAA